MAGTKVAGIVLLGGSFYHSSIVACSGSCSGGHESGQILSAPQEEALLTHKHI